MRAGFALPGEVSVMSALASKRPLSIRWLGHGTFLLTSPAGKRILIDPWGVAVLELKPEETRYESRESGFRVWDSGFGIRALISCWWACTLECAGTELDSA